MLRISLDLDPDASYKQDRFFENLLQKTLKFVLSRRDNIITFNFNFILLPAEVNLILEKQGCKRTH